VTGKIIESLLAIRALFALQFSIDNPPAWPPAAQGTRSAIAATPVRPDPL